MKTHLIWIKFIFFFQSGSLVVLYPYLVIHMRSLGLNVEEVALVNGVIPVADIIGPPLAGFVADKIGNFRYEVASQVLLSHFSTQVVHVSDDRCKWCSKFVTSLDTAKAPIRTRF